MQLPLPLFCLGVSVSKYSIENKDEAFRQRVFNLIAHVENREGNLAKARASSTPAQRGVFLTATGLISSGARKHRFIGNDTYRPVCNAKVYCSGRRLQHGVIPKDSQGCCDSFEWQCSNAGVRKIWQGAYEISQRVLGSTIWGEVSAEG